MALVEVEEKVVVTAVINGDEEITFFEVGFAFDESVPETIRDKVIMTVAELVYTECW